MNWYKKSQLNSSFDKITLDMYIKFLNDLLDKERMIPEEIKNEIPENIANNPEIQELFNASVMVNEKGEFWSLDGKSHRRDGPAIEHADGNEYWFINGLRHREDGPAVELTDGTKMWYYNGKLHREDGPAIEYPNGTKKWYLNNKRHREDGPAIIYPDGSKAWWLWWIDKELTEEEFNNELV